VFVVFGRQVYSVAYDLTCLEVHCSGAYRPPGEGGGKGAMPRKDAEVAYWTTAL